MLHPSAAPLGSKWAAIKPGWLKIIRTFLTHAVESFSCQNLPAAAPAALGPAVEGGDPGLREKPVEVVCGVIFDPAGRILACRRARHRHLGGLWEFPGGKVEPGESPQAALIRELAEELDWHGTVTLGAALAPVEFAYPERVIRLLPFRGQWIPATPGILPQRREVEHEELRWLRLDELDEVPWAAADLPIVAELRRESCGE